MRLCAEAKKIKKKKFNCTSNFHTDVCVLSVCMRASVCFKRI